MLKREETRNKNQEKRSKKQEPRAKRVATKHEQLNTYFKSYKVADSKSNRH